ncbi:MAG: hypothetical protein ACRD0E_07565, partial [Acidimicrobiales bacterium]
PLWAALFALINSSCPSAGTIGFANPALYQGASSVPGLFNDVTLGNNDYTGANPGIYPAATGYDLATGLGSPVATAPAQPPTSPPTTSPPTTSPPTTSPPSGPPPSVGGLAAYFCGLSQTGKFHPLPPTRVVDTRPGSGQGDAGMTMGPGSVLNVALAGLAGIPATGVGAVVLNVTAVDPSAAGYLTVYPAGSARPTASNLNFTPGQVVPGLVEVPLGSGSAVSVFNRFGTTDVVIDVEGYVADGTDGSGLFNPVTPYRIVDTRSPSSPGGSPSTLSPGGVLNVNVLGVGGVPSSGVEAVVLNLTAAGPSTPGFLTAYPGGSAQPTASNVNYVPGQAVANRVIVPVGANGTVSVFSSARTDVVVDVTGWFSGPGNLGGSGFVGSAPSRIADTRTSSGIAYGGSTLGPGATLKVQVTGVGGVPASGVKAVVANVTVTDTTSPGYLSVFGSGGPTPPTSDLNWRAGQTTSNLVVVGVGPDGSVSIYNARGSADVVVDVQGWYVGG